MLALVQADGRVFATGPPTALWASGATGGVGPSLWNMIGAAHESAARGDVERALARAVRGEAVDVWFAPVSPHGQAQRLSLFPLVAGDGTVAYVLVKIIGVAEDVWKAVTFASAASAADPARPPRGIVHDVNNGLATIKTACELLDGLVDPGSESEEYLQVIEAAVGRISADALALHAQLTR